MIRTVRISKYSLYIAAAIALTGSATPAFADCGFSSSTLDLGSAVSNENGIGGIAKIVDGRLDARGSATVYEMKISGCPNDTDLELQMEPIVLAGNDGEMQFLPFVYSVNGRPLSSPVNISVPNFVRMRNDQRVGLMFGVVDLSKIFAPGTYAGQFSYRIDY